MGKLDGERGFLLHEDDFTRDELARYVQAVREPAILSMDFIPPEPSGTLQWLRESIFGPEFPRNPPDALFAAALKDSLSSRAARTNERCGFRP